MILNLDIEAQRLTGWRQAACEPQIPDADVFLVLFGDQNDMSAHLIPNLVQTRFDIEQAAPALQLSIREEVYLPPGSDPLQESFNAAIDCGCQLRGSIG